MSDPISAARVDCQLLPVGGGDLLAANWAYVALDLTTGTLRALAMADKEIAPGNAPVIIGAGWVLRWPIPPIENDPANDLLESIRPHAEKLAAQVKIQHDRFGHLTEGGAGVCVDLIQRECAAAWRKFSDRRSGDR